MLFTRLSFFIMFTFLCPSWFLLAVFLSITEGGVLKSQNMIVDLSVSPFGFASFCFIYFEALLIADQTFRIGMSS